MNIENKQNKIKCVILVSKKNIMIMYFLFFNVVSVLNHYMSHHINMLESCYSQIELLVP